MARAIKALAIFMINKLGLPTLRSEHYRHIPLAVAPCNPWLRCIHRRQFRDNLPVRTPALTSWRNHSEQLTARLARSLVQPHSLKRTVWLGAVAELD